MEELGECVRAGKAASSEASLRALRLAKDHGIAARAPLLVVAVCEQLIKSGVLSEEEHLAVSDQLVEALLHLPSQANLLRAQDVLQMLEDRFPTSQRVGRLRALFEEARGSDEDAADVMEGVIQANEGNMIASRRIVAIRSADGFKAAVVALNEHLTTFGGDATAWAHLGEIFMRGGRFVLAAFCFSECVLLMPASSHSHSRAGECLLAAAEAEAASATGKSGHKSSAKDAAAGKRTKKDRKRQASRLAAVAAASAAGSGSTAVAEAGSASPPEPLALQARRHLAHAARLSGGKHIRTLFLLLEACAAVAGNADAIVAAAAATASDGTAPEAEAGSGMALLAAAKDNVALAKWARARVLEATAGAATQAGAAAVANGLVTACEDALAAEDEDAAAAPASTA